MSIKRITSYFESASKKSKHNSPLEADHNTIDDTSARKNELFFFKKA
jgi:hypothetical protein